MEETRRVTQLLECPDADKMRGEVVVPASEAGLDQTGAEKMAVDG